jgi:hypothetical protein
MNDDECRAVFDTLMTSLQAKGLAWVESQVRDQIRLGKTIEREREAPDEWSFQQKSIFEADNDREQPKAHSPATFPITVEYSAQERLQLLIDAIEHAVVNTAAMEESFTSYFETESPHFANVQFYSEDATLSPRIIDRPSAAFRTEKASQLHQLLEELRKEI